MAKVKHGMPRGQKGRILDFVQDRPFTLHDLKDAIERGELRDIFARNLDRYLATMCLVGQMVRTGEKRVVNGRSLLVYRAIPGAKAQSKNRMPEVEAPPEASPERLTHERLFRLGRAFGTLAPN
jgi:hypothetical protein